MNEVTQEFIDKFKLRIKLDGNDEDSNLKMILENSISDLLISCGPSYTIEENKNFSELVMERSRYVYNDAVEFFDNNFINQITKLNLTSEELTI